MKYLMLSLALWVVFAGFAFPQAQPSTQEPSPPAAQTAQTPEKTPDTPDPIDILLSAKTVFPAGDIGWREGAWLWGGPSPEKSQKRLEQELQKWGRFQTVSQPAEADLIMLLIEGTRQGAVLGGLGGRSQRVYSQLIVFKGGQLPKKLEQPIWQAKDDAGMFSMSAAGKVVARFRNHVEQLALANPGRQQLANQPSSKKAAPTTAATAVTQATASATTAIPVETTTPGNPGPQPQAATTQSVSPRTKPEEAGDRTTRAAADVQRSKVDAHHDFLGALVIPADGKMFASAALSDKTIKLWSLSGGRLLAKLSGHKSGVITLAVTPDGKVLVSGSEDHTVRLWSLPEGRPLATLEGHQGGIEALTVTPDGKVLVSGSEDHTVRLWSLPEGRPLATLEGHQGGIEALTVTPDGKVLASGSEDHTVRLWSLPEGRPLATLEGTPGDTRTLAVTPDGKMLISGGSHVRLWSLPEGRAIATLAEGNPVASSRGAAEDLAVTPDGKTLISAHDDGSIKLWSLPAGQPVATLREHRGRVASVVVAPDGKMFASGAQDDTVLLWSLPEGRLLASLVGHSGAPAILVFAPDGKTLVSGQKSYVVSITQTSNRTFNMQTHGNAGIVMLWDLERITAAPTSTSARASRE